LIFDFEGSLSLTAEPPTPWNYNETSEKTPQNATTQ